LAPSGEPPLQYKFLAASDGVAIHHAISQSRQGCCLVWRHDRFIAFVGAPGAPVAGNSDEVKPALGVDDVICRRST